MEEPINPYSVSLVINATKVVNNIKVYSMSDTPTSKEDSYLMDNTEHFKTFMSAELRDKEMLLSAYSVKLLQLIKYQTESGRDYVILSVDKAMKLSKMSEKTLRNSINELIDNSYIIKRRDIPHCYWINPNYFFVGNRMNKYPEKIIVGRTIVNGIK